MKVEDVEHFIDDWRIGVFVASIMVLIFCAGLIIWWLMRDHADILLQIGLWIVGGVLACLLLAFIGHLTRDIFSDRSHQG